MKTTVRLLLSILILGIGGASLGQDMGRSISLFSDIKANKVGQGLTVLVMEFSQARNESRTETKKESDHSVNVGGSSGLLGFLPDAGVNSETQNDYRGDARTTRKGSLKAKVAVKIVGTNQASDFIIEGKRVIEINNEKEIYIIKGAVREEDIMADNTVYSYDIYDAQITYRGKGEVSRSQKGGILTRFLQWIF